MMLHIQYIVYIRYFDHVSLTAATFFESTSSTSKENALGMNKGDVPFEPGPVTCISAAQRLKNVANSRPSVELPSLEMLVPQLQLRVQVQQKGSRG